MKQVLLKLQGQTKEPPTLIYNCRRQMKQRYVWFATAQKKKEKKKLLKSSYERNSPPKMPVTAAKNKLISEEEERTISKKGSVH